MDNLNDPVRHLSEPVERDTRLDRSVPDALANLVHLVISAQPEVVFTSLAALCVPDFSDECRIVIRENGRPSHRITRPTPPAGTRRSPTSDLLADTPARQFMDKHSIRTPILSSPRSSAMCYTGVVVHNWTGDRHPTPADARLAQRLVDRAVAVVQQERLINVLAQTRRAARTRAKTRYDGRPPELEAAISTLMATSHLTYAQASYRLRAELRAATPTDSRT
jgi:hypothetical protein